MVRVGQAGLEVEWLGCVPYAEALALQETAVAARRSGGRADRLILLEHPPVITLGRSAKPENVLATSEVLSQRGIERFEIRRGGDVTYHAPGQLVGYLVLDLAAAAARDAREPDVHGFLREIEAALVEASAELGVASSTVAGRTGVYATRPESDRGPARKIASIGVGLRGWVSYHGFALNVTMDLSGFDTIVPCGLEDVEMTSILCERSRWDGVAADRRGSPELDVDARRAVASAFRRHFAPSA